MQIRIQLVRQPAGEVRVTGECGTGGWEHLAGADEVEELQRGVAALVDSFEGGHRPLADPVTLAELGAQMRDTFLLELYAATPSPFTSSEGRLLFSSSDAQLLNLPWELLPGMNGHFLVADARWSIRRTTRRELPAASQPLVARPLRVLFTACAPVDQRGLDYEKEEEAILRIADRLQGRVHLDFAEAGSFDELAELISELKPHVVHLSGHGMVKEGVGHFAFENERGREDSRDAREMGERLFAGKGVRLVFVSGCQSAQAGVAGVCQSLTATQHVPLALGWSASVADDRATEFARSFYHELAAGHTVDHAAAVARRLLLDQGRVRLRSVEALDATFALPQVYAADDSNALVDEQRPPKKPDRPGVRYELLGDNIRGLREGFVGRRRVLQKTRPALRTGERTVLLLTGIGGAGKSTLATRLANRCKQDGYRVVAVQARREEAPQFCLRLIGEIATACQRLGREADERLFRDGQRPLADRLRLAIEILNEAKILLVLDNLEALMPAPPAPARWELREFAAFFNDLVMRLTGEGRAILTCRYLPGGFDTAQPNLLHEPLPDFTEADFFKYLRRHDKVAARMDRGELPRDLLALFHRKLGATPRFVEQASAVLATMEPDPLREQLEGVAVPEPGTEDDKLWELQQQYFADLFLPQLYNALPHASRLALSRLALVEIPLPLDGVAAVAGMTEDDARAAANHWLGLGLVQRFGEGDELPLLAVYPLQRAFLTARERLAAAPATEVHTAAARFFQECFERDREAELRLPVSVELFACLHHATEAGDRDRRRWAVVKLCWPMIRHADFREAVALAEPLLAEDRHPDLLQIMTRVAMDTGAWKEARAWSEEEQKARQAIGDRAGEAATWHNLATIDVNEGNYGDAREKFAKSLAMRQAIGDRAGEAATFYQIGVVAWRSGRKSVGIQLVGICFGIEQAIGSGGVQETLKGLLPMAAELGLSQDQLLETLRKAGEQFQRDRGAALVQEAFAGLQAPQPGDTPP